MKLTKRILLSLLLVVSLLLSCVYSITANALDGTEDVSLNIIYSYEKTKLSNAQFDIYYVASIDSGCNFTLDGKFVNVPVNVNLGSSDYPALAMTIYGYVQLDNIASDYTVKTDTNGEIMLSTNKDSLKQGMYLVTSKKLELDYREYSMSPYLVSLPNFNSEWLRFDYNIISYPKVSCKELERPNPDTETDTHTDPVTETDTHTDPVTETDTHTDPITETDTHSDSDSDTETNTDIDNGTIRTVKKKWADIDDPDRPDHVTIYLLRDGDVYDTFTLSESNRWTHKLTNLSNKYEWLVVEEPIKGYTVLVTSNENNTALTVTNTKIPLTETDSDRSSDTSKPPLPQTGSLWWAVVATLAAGLVLYWIGYSVKKSAEGNE